MHFFLLPGWAFQADNNLANKAMIAIRLGKKKRKMEHANDLSVHVNCLASGNSISMQITAILSQIFFLPIKPWQVGYCRK